ncbi:unnamed protein product [Dracunculus medinensis]|uniref:FXNA-like protease n=1 Tax=Dracunculus medinensis TaxID=318479 RepID=A0A158Q2Z2_DRAME|nr:unnamed protein product [Dracunculus medinensis]
MRPFVKDVGGAKAILDEFSPHLIQTKQKLVDSLGFRHWLLILFVVGTVYGLVVYQDNRMPSVIPAGQYKKFSEIRARHLLNALTDLGPRPSGSKACEVDAVNIITRRLNNVRYEIKSRGVNRFEMDIQRPSGCYDLKFLSSFTLCYSKITNIVARIGPATPAKHAILLNCHFDTLPDSPGATDDAVSCAILMEILDLYSHKTTALQNDIIFLFNGAEENFLQGSHGFITQHPWRHSIRAFVNLEGSGAGGREILFQAGPGNSWLLQTYLENAPYPHCSVLAQEIFQAGIIPSDTDFRVFRDYGRISGLDIAYFRNGWVYHTEFDLPKFIAEGCIQRAGENIYALIEALINSPYLDDQNYFTESNQWVFYDVIGLFTVFYSVPVGKFYNYLTALIILILVLYRIKRRIYLFADVLYALFHHAIAMSFMIAVGCIVTLMVIKLDLVMCWYKRPELVFPLYIFPMLLSGCTAHSIMARRSMLRNAEMVQYDSVLIIFASILFILTWKGFASAFYLLIHSFFPLLRDPLLFFLGKIGILRRVTIRWLLGTQLLCTVPVMVFGAYAVMLLFDFFVPVVGRLGQNLNPEFIVLPLSFLTAMSFVLFTNNLVYLTRRMDYLIKCGLASFLFFLLILSTTRLGWPYYYSESSPRLRRIIALDTKRTIFPFLSNESTVEHALFVQALDYRGISDLPEHTFLSGNKPDCRNISDEYCRFPFYTAIHEMFPPEEARWIPLPDNLVINDPITLNLEKKIPISADELKLSFVLKGGVDKSSLHLTPLNGFTLKKWSFTDLNVEAFGKRKTYFVFLTYGHEAPSEFKFWIHLKLENGSKFINIDELQTVPTFEVSVASHYAHGPHQHSETARQLRSLIEMRRKVPHIAVGWWKWAITSIIGVAQIVVYTF